ncbi:superoxide dismutase [Pelistega sp. NLN82]|uniref:Superoxide dismutase n=1 Tax=Pelistega ratti TaxID=2652177 RepID=A0A6L9Y9E5_9BURK|nr:superoxide dismutase [Pelistega ratti]NEN76408.1 superoxide dismutase [Pelistega ratti]
MRILVLDIPKEGVVFEDYLPYLLDETKHAWSLLKSDVIREIYFRQDRPGVVVIVEAESIEKAKEACSQFPLAKAGLIDFTYIPFGNYTLWENLFDEQHKI